MHRVLLALLVVWGVAVSRAGAAPTLLVHDVTIINPGEAPQPHRDILIERGSITSISPAVLNPKGTRVLDLPGRYILPGLVDMHAHVLLHQWDKEGRIAPRWDRLRTH